jgi:hypothetical protein
LDWAIIFHPNDEAVGRHFRQLVVNLAAGVIVIVGWAKVDRAALSIEDVHAEELVVEMRCCFAAWGVNETVGRIVDTFWAWRFNWAHKLDLG